MPLLSEMRSHIPIVHQKAVKAKVRPLAKVSKKHGARLREYAKLRAQFLKDHPYCQHWMMEHLVLTPEGQKVGMTLEDCEILAKSESTPWKTGWCMIPRSTEIHHTKGRGKFLLDTTTWLAVSAEGHRQIHLDPATSYRKGYMLPRR